MSTSERTRGHRGRVAARRCRRAAVVGVALGLVVAGCSCSKGDAGPPPNINTTLPGNKGASCVDGKGDIATYSQEGDGTLSEPSGIDLVAAKATLTESTLQVQFETVGPIDGTPQPEFVLFQGDTSETSRWELKARQNRDTKAWELALTTFKKDAQGRYVETPSKVTAPVKVEGNKLSYEVSQKDIPPAASYVWAFGSSSGTEPTTLSDYCDNSTGGGAPGTTTPGTTPGSTTPSTVPTASLRQSQTTKRGETVTIYSIESPPQSPQAGATPADPAPEALPGESPRPPFKLAVVDAKVCAPAGQGVTLGSFYVKDQDGTNWQVFPVAKAAHDPVLPAGGTLQANECKQGWVTLQLPETSNVAQVLYVVDTQNPNDALLWNA